MDPTASTTIFKDWSFWAVVVAAVAVILSQLPPLHLLLRRTRVTIEPYSRIHIFHRVGNPTVQLHLIVTNAGGRGVRVNGIKIDIGRDAKRVASLPAQNYLQQPGDKATVLFTSFQVRHSDDWAHIVNFGEYLSRANEKKFRSAESDLKNDILVKRKTLRADELAEVDPKLAAEFEQMMEAMFIWEPGEYEITISVIISKTRVATTRKYRFTLFESDTIELRRVAEDYKYGDGISYDSGKHLGVIVQMTEA